MSKLSDLLNPIQGTASSSEVSVVATREQENHPEPLPDPAVTKLVDPNTHSTTTLVSVTRSDVSASLQASPSYQNSLSVLHFKFGESQQRNNPVVSPSPLLEQSHSSHPQNLDQPQESLSQGPEQALTDISSLRAALPYLERTSEQSTHPDESDLTSGEDSGSQQNNHDTTEVQSHHSLNEAIETTSGPTMQTTDNTFISEAIPLNLSTQDAENPQRATPTVPSSETAPLVDTPFFHAGERRRAGVSVRGIAKRGIASSRKAQAKKQKMTKSASKHHAAASTNGSTPSAPVSSSPPPSSPSEDCDENDVEVFCVCRGPDDHTRMICCDSCDDWFHIRCVNITEEKADSIDKYICPNCHNDENVTTYKPLCRLPGCTQSARVEQKSKYCSDEHGREFMRRHVQETIAVPGGSLVAEELASVVQQTGDQEEFAGLGIAPPHAPHSVASEQNGDSSSELNGGTVRSAPYSHRYTAEEWARVGQIRWERQQLVVNSDLLRDKQLFLEIIEDQVDAEADRAGLPNICGFDSRLCWSMEEFAAWRATEVGQRALRERSLPHDRQPHVSASGWAGLMSLSICYERRCQRHHHWETVQTRAIRQDLLCLVQHDNLLKYELNELDERARVRRLLEVEGEAGGMVEIVDEPAVYY